MKTYLIAFNSAFAEHDKIIQFLDAQPAVSNWKAHFPFVVFFSTYLPPHEMAQKFEAKFGSGGLKMFLIIQIRADDVQGRLAPDVWSMITDPAAPPSGDFGR